MTSAPQDPPANDAELFAGDPQRRRHEPAATVTTYPDGPLLVRGDFELQEADGTVIDCRQRTVALCRCGRSAVKPFCDGTHKAGPARRRRTGDRQ